MKSIYSFRLTVVYPKIFKKGQRIAQFLENGKKNLNAERIEGTWAACFNGRGGMPNTADLAIAIPLITGKLNKLEQAFTTRRR